MIDMLVLSALRCAGRAILRVLIVLDKQLHKEERDEQER